jgi:hypothetical protein
MPNRRKVATALRRIYVKNDILCSYCLENWDRKEEGRSEKQKNKKWRGAFSEISPEKYRRRRHILDKCGVTLPTDGTSAVTCRHFPQPTPALLRKENELITRGLEQSPTKSMTQAHIFCRKEGRLDTEGFQDCCTARRASHKPSDRL